jgi:hypothetical protein
LKASPKTAAGLITFIFIGPHTSVMAIVVTLAVIGTVLPFSSPNTNAIISSVDTKN